MSLDFVNSRSIYCSSKRARSNIDEETRLVENRIRMIKFEEERANKRIHETREKIDEVYKARTRYLEDQHIKNITKEKEDKIFNSLQSSTRAMREFHDEKIMCTQQELLNIKHSQAKRVRGWKEFLKRKMHQQDLEKRRYNRKLKEAVQQSSKQGAMRLKLLNGLKQQKAKFDYDRRIEIENLRKSLVEQEMDLLGKEEKNLMERVANIHEIKKIAEQELIK